MQSPVVSQPLDGTLRIRAARLGGRTILTESAHAGAFHIGPPGDRAGDGRAEVIVQQVGPGLMPGDHVESEFVVEPGAHLVVVAQSATRVYPLARGQAATSVVMARVAAGGTLWLVNGEIIPYRDALFTQRSEVHLEPGARLLVSDIVTPGRWASGEHDAFTKLDLRTHVRLGDRSLLAERQVLEPALRTLSAPGRHGPFRCAGSVVAAGYPELPVIAGRGAEDGCWWAAGGTPPLTLVRVAGPSADAIRRLVSRWLHALT